MQEPRAWRQLNLPAKSTFIEFPMAFSGKPPKGGKATVFTGLLFSYRIVLAIIHTMNKMNGGEPAKITYKYMQERFGIYPDTFSAARKALEARKIIEGAGRSKYKIIVDYNKRNYLNIDDYLFHKEFYEEYEKSDGKTIEKVKNLSYTRIMGLSFLKRSVENPNTNGEYISSYERFGKALNLPESTAGDTLRELVAADLTRAEKPQNRNKLQRGCSKYTVNPEVLAVMHPSRNDFGAVNEAITADELHKRFMLDSEYKGLMERIDVKAAEAFEELRHSGGFEVTPEYERIVEDLKVLNVELDRYFVVHNVDRSVFPPGFFKCDNITEYDES